MIYLLTAIGLSPGGSTHLHTNSTSNDTKQTIRRATKLFWKSAGRAPIYCLVSWCHFIFIMCSEKRHTHTYTFTRYIYIYIYILRLPNPLYNEDRFFLGTKRPERGIVYPLPFSAEVEERVKLYLYSPSGPS